MVYFLSSAMPADSMMKNWLLPPFKSSTVRAIAITPRMCGSPLNSAVILGKSDPPDPTPLGSPP